MRQLTRFVATVAAGVMAATSAALLGFGTPVAAADDTTSGTKTVPLSSVLRRCDWSSAPYVPSDNKGSGYALITRTGNTVTAEVHIWPRFRTSGTGSGWCRCPDRGSAARRAILAWASASFHRRGRNRQRDRLCTGDGRRDRCLGVSRGTAGRRQPGHRRFPYLRLRGEI